jgi:uncharacterized protein YbaP (TraB family)
MFQKLIVALTAATLFIAPSAATAAKPAKKAAKAAKPAKPALWVVKDEDTTIYLFGTVHVMKPGVQWFEGPVKKAFDSSSELVVEMIEPKQEDAVPLVMQRAVDKDGPALTAKMKPEVAASYKKLMGEMGQPYQQFEIFEPWFVSNLLVLFPVQKAGYDAESGVDKVLMKAAKANGKKLGELESMSQQLDFFDKTPEDEQLQFLASTIRDAGTAAAEIDGMVASWAKGDPAGLDAAMNKGLAEFPGMRKRLLADRNANWAEWIDKRLDTPGTVFMAVGAGHLAGSDSVQQMLQGRNIKSARVK